MNVVPVQMAQTDEHLAPTLTPDPEDISISVALHHPTKPIPDLLTGKFCYSFYSLLRLLLFNTTLYLPFRFLRANEQILQTRVKSTVERQCCFLESLH